MKDAIFQLQAKQEQLRLTWPVHLVLDPHCLAFVAVLIRKRSISVDHPIFEQSFVLKPSFQVVLRKSELALPVELVVKHAALILFSTGQCKSLAIAILACLEAKNPSAKIIIISDLHLSAALLWPGLAARFLVSYALASPGLCSYALSFLLTVCLCRYSVSKTRVKL